MSFKSEDSPIFQKDEFLNLTDSSQEFIKGLLTEKVENRMSAKDAI
jgi:hypothetical protein